MKKIILFVLSLMALPLWAQNKDFVPAENATFKTDRSDGRYLSSRAVANQLMKLKEPALAFRTSMQKEDFPIWRENARACMRQLMKHPILQNLPQPVRVSTIQRDGYRVEKWESYPLPDCVVPYLVLIPDGADAKKPLPAALCIPGWGGTKEELAGEPQLYRPDKPTTESKNAMAYKYVKMGIIAVAVDNPGSGELADLEVKAGSFSYDFKNFARALVEIGWSYLGYASYTDQHILNWMKEQPLMRKDRLIVSGFSFGTEPLMALGALDESIYAFVYNDFLCRTRERDFVLTMPNENGLRGWPNDISHLIPEFLCNFDFPDMVASLAPRPVICTEGGLDRDLQMVAKAYELSGYPQNFTYYHYKELQDPSKRKDIKELPEGLDLDTFFQLTNVQPKNHYFKSEYILPWLKNLLGL